MIKDLTFEIIWKCPNNCLFCSSCSSYDKEKRIDFKFFKKTIDYLCEQGGIEEISLSGGEPFLHPDLFKMIAYCKSKNIRTVLFTSGIKLRTHFTEEEKQALENFLRNQYQYLLKEGMDLIEFEKLILKQMKIYLSYDKNLFDSISKEDFLKLKELGLDKIVFDFQAWNKEVYNKIMGTKNCYELILNSIIKASIVGLNLDAHFIPTKINFKELSDIIEMLNYINFQSLSILNFVPQGRGKENVESLMMNEQDYMELRDILEKEQPKFKGTIRIGIPLTENARHLCTAGLSKMVIKYDGTVLPCPAFKEFDIRKLNKLGIPTPNIFENLEDIKIKEGNLKEPLCKRLYHFNHNIR